MSSVSKIGIDRYSVTTTVVSHESALDKSLGVFLSSIGCENAKNVVGLCVEKKFATTIGDTENMLTAAECNSVIKNKVAVLALCSGLQCLVIQLINFRKLPTSLASFLQLPDITFVGVGIKQNLAKLQRDYGLECSNGFELGPLAAAVKDKQSFSAYGLADLASEVCYLKLCKKSASVALGDWSTSKLSQDHIRHATCDACACFLVGNQLLGGMFVPSQGY